MMAHEASHRPTVPELLQHAYLTVDLPLVEAEPGRRGSSGGAQAEARTPPSPAGAGRRAVDMLRVSPRSSAREEQGSRSEAAAGGQSASPCRSRLPPGWSAHECKSSGDKFYYHKASGRKQWDPPLAPVEEANIETVAISSPSSVARQRRSAPDLLLIRGAAHNCSGLYERLHSAQLVNGMPVWKMASSAVDRFLYSNHRGCWRVVHDLSATVDGKGWLCSAEHRDRWPDAVAGWRQLLWEAPDGGISVVECVAKRQQYPLEADRLPASLRVSAAAQSPAGGLYQLCRGELMNGHPYWGTTLGKQRKRLHSDRQGRWRVSDAGSGAEWLVSAYHGGALPHHVREWRRATDPEGEYSPCIAISASDVLAPTGAGSSQPAPALPPGWKEHRSPSGEPFYVHNDGRKTWAHPGEARARGNNSPSSRRGARTPLRRGTSPRSSSTSHRAPEKVGYDILSTLG
eukprot:Hpha_TRINITY_DN14243_c0_g2::TRINITY_DN14243_c0_g2_i1::g.22620::m.22620